MSRATLYRWRQRFDPPDPPSLRERSRRPKRRRPPQGSVQLIHAGRRWRETSPRGGEEKLVGLLQREGVVVAASPVGRLLAWLKRHGRLVDPPPRRISTRRRRLARPAAVRKPKEDQPPRPGDLVQVDPLEIRPRRVVPRKPFTARDGISRGDALETQSRATTQGAARVLQAMQRRRPFPIRSVPVDGGSESCTACAEAWHQAGIRLLVLPPKSPTLNGAVERAQWTPTKEFYQVTDCAWPVEALNQELRQWERIFNTIQPHQAPGYWTPLQFLRPSSTVPPNCPSLSHMS